MPTGNLSLQEKKRLLEKYDKGEISKIKLLSQLLKQSVHYEQKKIREKGWG